MYQTPRRENTRGFRTPPRSNLRRSGPNDRRVRYDLGEDSAMEEDGDDEDSEEVWALML